MADSEQDAMGRVIGLADELEAWQDRFKHYVGTDLETRRLWHEFDGIIRRLSGIAKIERLKRAHE